MSGTGQPSWRPWLAEALGTGLLVAFGIGAVALARAGVLPELAANTLAPGLVILALVYLLSDLSGAHFNPAVTLAFALRGSFPWTRVPGHLAAQVLGALAGAWSVAALLPLPRPREQVPPLGAFGLEVACTALLMLVILAAAKRKAEVGPQTGVAVGATLALCHFTAGSVSAVGLNSARALASALFTGTLGGAWPHLLGPLAGGALAAGLTWLLRGPLNGDEAEAAQGKEAR